MKKLIVTAVAALMSFTVAAEARTWECEAEAQQTGGWIPPVLIIQDDGAGGDVRVKDSLIVYYIGDTWVDGRLDTDNAKRITYRWELKNFGGAGSEAKQFVGTFSFSATIMKATGELVIWSKPNGYANKFRGNGACVQAN